MPTMKQYILVGLAHRMIDELIPDHALVDKKVLHVGLTAIKRR